MHNAFLNLWRPLVEISILWYIFYRIILFFQGTRAFQVLRGLIILIIAFFIFQVLGLETLNWLLTKLFAISILGIIILFQPELRQGLARLGQQHLFSLALKEEEQEAVLQEVVKASVLLSQRRYGALIALEQETRLKVYIESGIELDSKVSSELIQSIFSPESFLHDGGMIIRGDRIVAASCLFPLSERADIDRALGTRHRAALGLSEETDAVVVIVSEETGAISLAVDGRLIQNLSQEQLLKILRQQFKKGRA